MLRAAAGILIVAMLAVVINDERTAMRWSRTTELLPVSGGPATAAGAGANTAAGRIEREEATGLQFKRMASQFRKAARVAAEEEKDAHRKGPVDTLEEASQRLDAARGKLASSADHAALGRLAASLREYSRALQTHADGLEFEAPGAYKELSDFELKHPLRPMKRQRTRVQEDEVSSSLRSASAHAREAQRLARRAVARSRPRGGVRRHESGHGVASETAWARHELKTWAARPGPRHAFPTFARGLKTPVPNFMGNILTAVNAL